MDEAISQKRKRLESGSDDAISKKVAAEAEDESDDCQILDQTIPLIVLDSSDMESTLAADATSGDEDTTSEYVWVEKTDVPSVSTKPDESKETIAPPVNDEPLLRLHFRDNETFVQLKAAVHQAIRDALFKFKKTIQVDEDSCTFQLTVRETTDADDCIFMIDNDPSTSKKANKTDVPLYSRPVAKVMDHTIAAENEADGSDECKRDVRPKANCFNCDGDHNMRDCKEPKNLKKIRENRMQFSSQRVERYHVDLNQRFGQFVPGVCSNPLREALGLRENELPLHVYRMRLLGYPPGWLEDAKVDSSGLALFDDKTNADDTNKEDEVVKYDLNKIISYPGFNVVPEPGFYDMSYKLRLPQMAAHQCKQFMIDSLSVSGQSAKSYKRQKMKENPVQCPDGRTVDLSNPEMDLDEGELSDDISAAPPLPGCQPQTQPPPPPRSPSPMPPGTEDSPASPDIDETPGSPSLDELKKQQELLLAALDDSTISVAPGQSVTNDDSLIDDILALDTTQSSTGADTTLETSTACVSPEPSSTSCIDPTTPANSLTSPTDSFATPSTPITPMNSSKHSVSGTPLIESVSPFSTLPVGACWSVGVSDVIDFENLADSTGKFEKMKGVIQKVRVAVKQLNNEYEH